MSNARHARCLHDAGGPGAVGGGCVLQGGGRRAGMHGKVADLTAQVGRAAPKR